MKVLNFGSLNIDYVYDVEEFVKKGETVSSLGLNVFAGGKGLNQSIALARAGANVFHAGMIGEDGRFLTELLAEAGVNIENVHISSRIRSGNALIQRDKSGDNCIILFSGANRAIDKKYADEVLAGFEKGDFLVLQNEISELPYIVRRASERGMKIVLNPSPMDDRVNELDLNLIDYFILNETEAMKLSGASKLSDMMRLLSERYTNAGILITLGEDGAVFEKAGKRIEVEAVRTEVVDTTAAGDTFTGYFVAGIMSGDDIETVLKRAAKASAITVSRPGAGISIPHMSEVGI